MDKVILGLLVLQSRTIYQLRKRIDEGLNMLFSSSTGSIQAALRKLMNCGYVRCESLAEDGRKKRLYSITESGKQHFREWVNSPIEAKTKSPEAAKLYFLGFSDEDSRAKSVRAYISQMQERRATLDAICAEGETMAVDGEGKDILEYQLAAARYGRDLMGFNIGWYERLLREMEG